MDGECKLLVFSGELGLGVTWRIRSCPPAPLGPMVGGGATLSVKLLCNNGDFGICDGQCRDFSSDVDNCGACDVSVGDKRTCTHGKPVCVESYQVCGSKCVNVGLDEEHCGQCNRSCEAVAKSAGGQDENLCDGGRCVFTVQTTTFYENCNEVCASFSGSNCSSGRRNDHLFDLFGLVLNSFSNLPTRERNLPPNRRSWPGRSGFRKGSDRNPDQKHRSEF